MPDYSADIPYLERLGKGDKDAFAALYRKYAGQCANFALTLLKDKDAARDITHDVFVRIWNQREHIAGVTSFSSYLYKMMRNEVLLFCGRTQINRRYLDYLSSVSEEFRAFTDEETDLEDLRISVATAVDRMPEQRARVFTMSRMEGLSHQKIAELLGISVRTVEKHITNALLDIREEIKDNLK
ncbi:MAG: RNA polymerase sigma-70 factor [Candidatus Cryptobacteroides sp.]